MALAYFSIHDRKSQGLPRSIPSSLTVSENMKSQNMFLVRARFLDEHLSLVFKSPERRTGSNTISIYAEHSSIE
jgi:hypothetical protein